MAASSVQKLLLLIWFLGFVVSSPIYFGYESDCPVRCVALKESCTIQENGDDFDKICYKQDSFCVERASPESVCLRTDGQPLGGEKIWEAYRQKYYPDKTKCSCSYIGLYVSVGFNIITIIIISLKALLMIVRKTRRTNHVRLPNDVYNDTVEDIE